MDVYIVHQGFLTKRGKKIKNWKRRWFVLKSNGELTYFKLQIAPEEQQELPRPAGTLVVDNAALLFLREEMRGFVDWGSAPPGTGFCIRTGDRDFYVWASSQSERKVWLQRLRNVQDMSRKHARPTSSFRSVSSDETNLATGDGREKESETVNINNNETEQHKSRQESSSIPDSDPNKITYTELEFTDDEDDEDDGDDGGYENMSGDELQTTTYAELSFDTIEERDHEYVNVEVTMAENGLRHFALRDTLPEAEEAVRKSQASSQSP